MVKVSPETLSPAHVRTGRALLGGSTREFASFAGEPVTMGKLRNLENGLPASTSTRAAIIAAFDRAGIELFNGGKPGARVRDKAAYEAALGEVKA